MMAPVLAGAQDAATIAQAKSGDLNAQAALGAMYIEKKDYKQGVYWCQKAADQGDATAQFLLGDCYYKGNGVAKDLDMAKHWLKKAAAQGSDNAYELLEQFYLIEDETNASDDSEVFSAGSAKNIQMPTYPGGMNALVEFLSNNISYPAKCEKEGITGRVVCKFIVEANGKITNVEVVQSVHPLLDREAVRVIRSMPNWIPGNKDGEAIRVSYNIPISFNL